MMFIFPISAVSILPRPARGAAIDITRFGKLHSTQCIGALYTLVIARDARSMAWTVRLSSVSLGEPAESC